LTAQWKKQPRQANVFRDPPLRQLIRHATILHRFLAGANFLMAVMRVPMPSEILDPAGIDMANGEFERLFPPTLPEMTALALKDHDGYD